jgi:tetratricopeptide (TPR) repeat protein
VAYRKTIELAQRSLAVNPRSAETLAILGMSQARAGLMAPASEAFQRALGLSPTNPEVLLMAALGARLAGRSGEALSLIGRGLSAGLSENEIETEPDFDPIRQQPEYRALVERHRLEKKEKNR